jgi:hypothetical protein
MQNRKKVTYFLIIQASLPKIVYGHSLLEVDETLYELILHKIKHHAQEFGVNLFDEQISEAIVTRVDFSKVVKLPKPNNAKQFIQNLSSSGYRPRADLTKRDIRNGRDGFWIKFYNKSSSLTIYDKVAEICNQGYTKEEKELSELNKLGKLSNSTIKFEVSLQKKRKVTNLLNKLLNQNKDYYTFKDIFNKEISQKVLIYYLHESFNNEVDFLTQFKDDKEVRSLVRNLYGYQNKSSIYFLWKEIQERGVDIVFKEIKLLHGSSKLNTVKQNLKSLNSLILELKGNPFAPVKHLNESLSKFDLYTEAFLTKHRS